MNAYHCPYSENIPSTTFKLRDSEYDLEMEEIKIYNIYLPDYINLCYDKYAKDEEKTIAMLNARNYKMMRSLAERNVERMSLYIMARECAKSPEFMKIYDEEAYEEAVRDEMKEQGRTLGLEEGRQERNIEIAKKMLGMGLTLEQISEATGLSIEEIKKLEK